MKDERGLKVHSKLTIPFSEFHFSYTTSSGAGGQNVNKVSTKAVLRWTPNLSPVLSIEAKQRFLELYSSRLTHDGELIVVSQKFRSQAQNAQDCLEKLKMLILPALLKPKVRKATRPTLGSKKRRLKEKTNRSEIKQNRRPVGRPD